VNHRIGVRIMDASTNIRAFLKRASGPLTVVGGALDFYVRLNEGDSVREAAFMAAGTAIISTGAAKAGGAAVPYIGALFGVAAVPGVIKVVVVLACGYFAGRAFVAAVDALHEWVGPINPDDIHIPEGAVQEIMDAYAAWEEWNQPGPHWGD